MTDTIRIAARSGSVLIDGYPGAFPGGSLRASLAGDTITVANVMGGAAVACARYDGLADGDGRGFASSAAAMAYLAGILAVAPSRTVEGVTAVAIAAGLPLAVSRATGLLVPARADTYPLAFVAGLATAAAAAGFAAQAGCGAVSLPDWTMVTGAAALAPGQPYFLAPSGGLSVQAIAPGAACVARIGLAASPTTLIVDPADPILL